LFKSEPDVYSFADLQRDRRTNWHGVRNYQARNLLRDEIQVGDGVLFYHSNAEPMAIVGICRVVKSGYPDASAADEDSEYHDADADPAQPRWFQVDVVPVRALPRPLARDELRAVPALAGMMLLRRGARLSVQPVSRDEWRTILKLAGVEED
jgi:predicted RNA-binding protein with PUA-like domain